MSSKTWIAAGAAFVVMFLLGYLFYGVLLMDFYAANGGTATGVMKEAPVFPWLILGEFLGALTLTVILAWAGARTAGDGLKKGAIFGFLITLALGFVWLGTANISNLTSTIVDSFVSAVRFGAGGWVIGKILGPGPTV